MTSCGGSGPNAEEAKPDVSSSSSLFSSHKLLLAEPGDISDVDGLTTLSSDDSEDLIPLVI